MGTKHAVVQSGHELGFGGFSPSRKFGLDPQGDFNCKVIGVAEGGLTFALKEPVVLSVEGESMVVLAQFP